MRAPLLTTLLLAAACASTNSQRDGAMSATPDAGSDAGAKNRDGGASDKGGAGGTSAVSGGDPRDSGPGGRDGAAAGDAAAPDRDASVTTDAGPGADGGAGPDASIAMHACPLVDTCGSHQGTSCPAQPPKGECSTQTTCFYCQGAATRPAIAASCSLGTWSWTTPQPCAN
jgi:hypothetical protein